MPVTLLSVLISVGHAAAAQPTDICAEYHAAVSRDPAALFADNLDAKTKSSLDDYLARAALPNQKVYGSVSRSFIVGGRQKVQTLDEKLSANGCRKKFDWIRNPTNNEIVTNPDGSQNPLWIYLCDDGSVVRIKPQGDPTSKFLPQPIVSKSLRYPYDSDFRSFSDETIKVDDDGFPVPKWPRDLKRVCPGEEEHRQYMNCWSADAHKDVLN